MLLPLIAASVLSSAPVQKLREFALKLDVGDPQMYVLDNLGTPDGNASQTCGTKTDAPFECLVWTYKASDSIGDSLVIVFYREKDKSWAVNNWSI